MQLWKSSQYLARNRTNRRSRFTLGAGKDPAPAAAPLTWAGAPPYLLSTALAPGSCEVSPLWTLAHPRTCGQRRGPSPSTSGFSPRVPGGEPSSQDPGRTGCAALAPRPAQTDCLPSLGKARKTVLSLASCRPLMPLSLQDGLLAPSAALPTGLLTFSSPSPLLPPSLLALRYFLACLRPLSPSTPFLLFPVLVFSLSFLLPSLSSSFLLPSVFLCSVPHFFPIVACFGPPVLRGS